MDKRKQGGGVTEAASSLRSVKDIIQLALVSHQMKELCYYPSTWRSLCRRDCISPPPSPQGEGELWDPFADPNIDWREVFKQASVRPFLEEIKLVPKTGIWPFIRQRDYLCCFLTGQRNSGKSTAFYKLKLGEFVIASSTKGYNRGTIDYKKTSVIIVECPWEEYSRHPFLSKGADCVVYMVDSNDRASLELAKVHIKTLNTNFAGCPILVIANKQDIWNCVCVQEIIDKLELRQMQQTKWFCQPACSPTGEGLHEALDWLCSTTKNVVRNRAAASSSWW